MQMYKYLSVICMFDMILGLETLDIRFFNNYHRIDLIISHIKCKYVF